MRRVRRALALGSSGEKRFFMMTAVANSRAVRCEMSAVPNRPSVLTDSLPTGTELSTPTPQLSTLLVPYIHKFRSGTEQETNTSRRSTKSVWAARRSGAARPPQTVPAVALGSRGCQLNGRTKALTTSSPAS